MDSVVSLINSYLDLNFEVVKKVDISRYANGNDIKLVNLGTIALFNKYKVTASAVKHLEDVSHVHFVHLLHKLLTSAKDTEKLSIGFDRYFDEMRRELTNNKNLNRRYQVRIMLKDVFGFAEYQEKATLRLGYEFTLTRNKKQCRFEQS